MAEPMKEVCGNCELGKQAYFKDVTQTRNTLYYTYRGVDGEEHRELVCFGKSKDIAEYTSPAGIQRCCLRWSSLHPRDVEEDSPCVNPKHFEPKRA